MDAATLLITLEDMGVTVQASERGTLLLDPGSKITPELLDDIRAQKPNLLAVLSQREGQELANELDRLLKLGHALTTGQVQALRCGKTGRTCINCGGVPCLWSEAIE